MLDLCEGAWRDGWTPDPILPLSEWADANVILSSKDSSEPGPYRSARTPYAREISDCLAPSSPIEVVVLMAGAQLGKTRIGLNWIGYVVDVAPGPMLMVEPTVDLAKKVSKQRLAPMIESTPALRGKVAEARSRDSGNTMFEKEFPGGILMITGANSAVGLRAMPIRYLFLDEVDGYPGDVEGEGDPIELARKRTSTFARKKILMTSTPTIKGLSRIEGEFLLSDQRRYFVPCPHCGFMDWIRWERIQWQERKPETAALLCVGCGALIHERHKTAMLAAGEWRPTAEGPGRTAGFHLSSLYAPAGWVSWPEIVTEFLTSKDKPEKLKTWINTRLAETWEEKGDEVDAEGLRTRIEDYGAEVPIGVGLLTASVDVPGDRLELKVKGWGAGEESWLIATHQVDGDPVKATTWNELDKMLLQTYTHASGRQLAIRSVAVDSGGLHTDQVYRFVKPRESRRIAGAQGDSTVQYVRAIKGVGGPGEIVGRPSTGNRYHVKLYAIHVDTAKDTVFSRMHSQVPGPGYLHLPAWVDDEYLAQLTSEKAIRKYKKGVGSVREYVKTRERNEALDLEVYALAALYILGRQTVARLGQLVAALGPKVQAEEPQSEGWSQSPASPGSAGERRSWFQKKGAKTPGATSWVDDWK
jgi:phage terminase large subunit GpA-like protein